MCSSSALSYLYDLSSFKFVQKIGVPFLTLKESSFSFSQYIKSYKLTVLLQSLYKCKFWQPIYITFSLLRKKKMKLS